MTKSYSLLPAGRGRGKRALLFKLGQRGYGKGMKALDPPNRKVVLDILDQARDLTLATVRPDGYPQATAISYAHDGLTIYASVSLGSQKAQNIQAHDKVSLTVNCEYGDWSHIKGLSMGGLASIVHGADEVQHAYDCMLHKFPELRTLSAQSHPNLWEGAVFIRITPQVISVLDYQKGFGHAELFSVA